MLIFVFIDDNKNMQYNDALFSICGYRNGAILDLANIDKELKSISKCVHKRDCKLKIVERGTYVSPNIDTKSLNIPKEEKEVDICICPPYRLSSRCSAARHSSTRRSARPDEDRSYIRQRPLITYEFEIFKFEGHHNSPISGYKAGRESNEEIIEIEQICHIPLELICIYYAFISLTSYTKIKFGKDFSIKIVPYNRILFTYNKKYYRVCYLDISKGFESAAVANLLGNLKHLYPTNMTGLNNCVGPNFKQVIKQFFNNYYYSPYNIYSNLISQWKLTPNLGEGFSIDEYLNIPHIVLPFGNEKLSQESVLFELAITNYINNEEEWQNLIEHIRPVEINELPYTYRPIMDGIYCNGDFIIIPVRMVPNCVLEDSTIFDDEQNIKWNEINLAGINHVYRYVENVFNLNIATQEEKLRIMKIFNIDNLDNVLAQITKQLDLI